MINEDVCEGCGDCVAKSGCSAIKTVQTEFGEKRQIEQAHCIQDLACVEGYCPAFVEIKGSPRNRLKYVKPDTRIPAEADTPSEANILIAGVGGTGVITLSQVIAVAAHLDNKQASTLDMTGLAQKGGAVISHIRIGVDHVWRTRLAQEEADVLIAADPVTATSQEVAPLLSQERTRAVVNEVLSPSHLSVVDAERDHGVENVLDELTRWVLETTTIDAMAAADEFAGTGTVANSVLLGLAYQRGLLPLSLASLRRAIELNGVAVNANLAAFDAGRRRAEQSKRPLETGRIPDQSFESLDEFIERRVKRLNIYQNSDYAAAYLKWVKRVRIADVGVANGELLVTRMVADVLFHYMAIKDEYEVARLLTEDGFKQHVAERFDNAEISYAFAPTWLRQPSKNKRRIGSWVSPILKIIASLRMLRGTFLDPFRFSEERKLDRWLLERLTSDVEHVLGKLNERNYETAVELLAAYRKVKGFGHVRQANWQRVESDIASFRNQLIEPSQPRLLASDHA